MNETQMCLLNRLLLLVILFNISAGNTFNVLFNVAAIQSTTLQTTYSQLEKDILQALFK